jgi:hypothetical protein
MARWTLPFDLKTYDVVAYTGTNLDELRDAIQRTLANVVPTLGVGGFKPRSGGA